MIIMIIIHLAHVKCAFVVLHVCVFVCLCVCLSGRLSVLSTFEYNSSNNNHLHTKPNEVNYCAQLPLYSP